MVSFVVVAELQLRPLGLQWSCNSDQLTRESYLLDMLADLGSTAVGRFGRFAVEGWKSSAGWSLVWVAAVDCLVCGQQQAAEG